MLPYSSAKCFLTPQRNASSLLSEMLPQRNASSAKCFLSEMFPHSSAKCFLSEMVPHSSAKCFLSEMLDSEPAAADANGTGHNKHTFGCCCYSNRTYIIYHDQQLLLYNDTYVIRNQPSAVEGVTGIASTITVVRYSASSLKRNMNTKQPHPRRNNRQLINK